MNINELIIEYRQNVAKVRSLSPSKSVWELLKEFTNKVREYKNPEQEILDALIQIYENRQWKKSYDWLTVAQLHPSNKYSEVLSKILNLQDENAPNEAIVDLLIDLKEPRCFYAVKNILSANFISQDEQLLIKILELLSEIGGDEAISLLQKFSKSPSITIREEANLLLEEMEQ
jgi:hypothetical protein